VRLGFTLRNPANRTVRGEVQKEGGTSDEKGSYIQATCNKKIKTGKNATK